MLWHSDRWTPKRSINLKCNEFLIMFIWTFSRSCHKIHHHTRNRTYYIDCLSQLMWYGTRFALNVAISFSLRLYRIQGAPQFKLFACGNSISFYTSIIFVNISLIRFLEHKNYSWQWLRSKLVGHFVVVVKLFSY